MAKETTFPVPAGLSLWKSCAIESVFHGIEVLSMNNEDIDKMESTQAMFGASLIGVRHSTSASGVLMELGLPKISFLVHLRKLKFWRRLCALPEENWAKQAFLECHKGAHGKNPCLIPDVNIPSKPVWSSSYVREMNKIIDKYNLQNVPFLQGGFNKDVWKNIYKILLNCEKGAIIQDIIAKQDHSLSSLPEYPRNFICQDYLLKGGLYSETLAKFRLGNAGL